MSAQPIDYEALAKQYGAVSSQPAKIDYDALAKEHGAVSSTAPPKTETPGFVDRLKENLGIPKTYAEAKAQFMRNLGHPVEDVTSGVRGAYEGVKSGLQSGFKDFDEAAQNIKEGGPIAANIGKAVYGGVQGAVGGVGAPVGGQQLMNMGADIHAGNYRGAAGTATGIMGQTAIAGGFGEPEAITKAASQLADAVPSPRGVMAARMAEKPVGEQFTRQEILDAARDKGVNLDLADATGSGVARGAKNSASISIAGKGTMEGNAAKNLTALEDWANSTADQYSPQSAPREQVGAQMQEALKSHLAARKSVATQAFQELDKTLGANKVDVSGSVQEAAQAIIDQNKNYYESHPELKPKQAWNVLNDLSQHKEMSWSELHTLRSDLMDFYRNNPDVVKGRSDAWIQQMVGKIDNAMTQSANGLKGDDLAQFRNANNIWESIKSTYDNPQSPYYQAVRTQYPSNLPGNLSGSRPELARQVRDTLGSLQDGGTVEGAFQRQFVENLLNNKSGALDLKNLHSRLSRMPEDVLQAMVGEDGSKNLRMLGKVAQKVTGDVNPSASGKVLAPFSEGALLFTHPIAGVAELGANYAASKVLTNPKAIDFLTKKQNASRK